MGEKKNGEKFLPHKKQHDPLKYHLKGTSSYSINPQPLNINGKKIKQSYRYFFFFFSSEKQQTLDHQYPPGNELSSKKRRIRTVSRHLINSRCRNFVRNAFINRFDVRILFIVTETIREISSIILLLSKRRGGTHPPSRTIKLSILRVWSSSPKSNSKQNRRD